MDTPLRTDDVVACDRSGSKREYRGGVPFGRPEWCWF
jgi:hypothetical protein